MWALLIALGIAIFLGALGLVGHFASDRSGRQWLRNPATTTGILAMSAAPLAFLFWVARDRSKKRELAQADSAQAQGVFVQLQEWAAGENEVLQAAAIYQLRPFILGEAEGVIPVHLSGEHGPFMAPAEAVIRAILDDRSWLQRRRDQASDKQPPADIIANEEAVDYADRLGISPETLLGPTTANKSIIKELSFSIASPVQRAVESILMASRGTGSADKTFPARKWDFSDWHLSNLNLMDAPWDGVIAQHAMLAKTQLAFASLRHSNLRLANLFGANFLLASLEEAKLMGADLRSAHLLWADLREADLRQVNLRGANLEKARLQGADLRRAILEDANLRDAKLEGAIRPENDIPGWEADSEGRLVRVRMDPETAKEPGD